MTQNAVVQRHIKNLRDSKNALAEKAKAIRANIAEHTKDLAEVENALRETTEALALFEAVVPALTIPTPE